MRGRLVPALLRSSAASPDQIFLIQRPVRLSQMVSPERSAWEVSFIRFGHHVPAPSKRLEVES
jgi:hypothetical protein